MAGAAVAFYRGTEPLEPGRVPAMACDASGDLPGEVLRAVAVASCRSRFTWSDLSTTTLRQDHVILLAPSRGRWCVYSDRYQEPRLAGWLRAGGAGTQQVRWAQTWATLAQQVRHSARTPQSAVRRFIEMLDERRYPEAGLLLDPAFGGTAQGMGMWLKSVHVVAIRPAAEDGGEVRLLVTLDVQARPSPWNDGENVRWFTLVRRGSASNPWRISAIVSGP
jgi:hypothetical protein